MRDPSQLVLSAVAILEIVIKHVTGRLRLDGSPAELVDALLQDGVSPLDVTPSHALKMASLPPLHRDPFDRLLVSQALVEGLTLVTADPNIRAYDVTTIDAAK